MLWEFESEVAPAEADHGENIVLAQWDPTGRGITGPLNRPTGRPRTSVGAQPGGPRTGVKHGNGRPPRARGSIPQWLKDRFARGNRNEARVRSDQGLPKNTQTVEGRDKDGNTVKTIPDSLPPGQVVEIKDVKILSNTRQIQAQASYAKANNREYVVYTGPRGSTHITQPARDTITRAGGRIVEVPYLGKGD